MEEIVIEAERLRNKLCNAEITGPEVLILWKLIDIMKNVEHLLQDSCWRRQ